MSSYLCIDKAATTRAVQSLMQKEYVIKQKDGLDKRFNRVFTTEKAEAIRDEVMLRASLWNVFLTEGMDDASRTFMLKALSDMAAKVEYIDFRKEWSE
jgi:DNA-binding MarR family transcriptional regulator